MIYIHNDILNCNILSNKRTIFNLILNDGRTDSRLLPNLFEEKPQQYIQEIFTRSSQQPHWSDFSIAQVLSSMDTALFNRSLFFDSYDQDNDKGYSISHNPIYFSDNHERYTYIHNKCVLANPKNSKIIAHSFDDNLQPIQNLKERCGILNRKLRVVSENYDLPALWIKWAQEACKSIFSYSDNPHSVVFTRVQMLNTLIEYANHYHIPLSHDDIFSFAIIISKNIHLLHYDSRESIRPYTPCFFHDWPCYTHKILLIIDNAYKSQNISDYINSIKIEPIIESVVDSPMQVAYFIASFPQHLWHLFFAHSIEIHSKFYQLIIDDSDSIPSHIHEETQKALNKYKPNHVLNYKFTTFNNINSLKNIQK